MYRIFDVIIRRVAAIAAFLLVLCSAPSCLQQEEYGKHSDGYREAGGMSCALEPETKSILYNGMNTAGTGSWFAAIYNSEGKLERNVVDIRKEISFTYPHVHIAGGFDTDGKGSDHDSPYVYGYLDDTYTIFLVINIPPCNGGDNLVQLANRMFPENLSDVDGRLYISDFQTSEGATGYEAIHDYNLMPKSGKMVSASFRTGIGKDVVKDETTSTIRRWRLLHPVQFSLISSNGDITSFNPSESYICNMAADIDVFDFNNSKPQSVIAHSFEQLLGSELTTLNNGGEVFFYVLENCQGTVSSITSSEGRTKDNLVSLGYTDVAAKATYIETVVSPTHQRLDGNAYLRCYLFDGETGSDYSSFNVTRTGYTRLAFDVNYERFVNPDWQVDFQGTEKKFDYYFESTGSHQYSKNWNHQFEMDGDTYYGEKINFINHFLQYPESDLLYYITVHDYKNASGSITTRTWGPFYRDINDTDGYFEFSKYNRDVHGQYVNYYGSDAYGFDIICPNESFDSGYDGDVLFVRYLGQLSNSNEYWTIKAVIHEGQANEESVSIDLTAPLSDTPTFVSDVTSAYVGQQVYLECDLAADSWSIVDAEGHYVSGLSTPDGYWNKLDCRKAGEYVILIEKNGHVTRQPFTIYDPVLQYNAGDGWKSIFSSLATDWTVDMSSTSVNFRYVDRDGNAITDFDSGLFSQLLTLQYDSFGAMFSNNALSASVSLSRPSLTMNVNLAALSATQVNNILVSQDGSSDYASYYAIYPKYRYGTGQVFWWNHTLKRIGTESEIRLYNVDNRYYLTRSSNRYAVLNQAISLNVNSASSVTCWCDKSYTVTPIISSVSDGKVVISGLDILCGSYKGEMRIIVSVKNNAGVSIYSIEYPTHVFLSAGVGLYTFLEHGDWFVSPVYINARNNGTNIRNLIGGGVVWYNADTEYQDRLDICSEDFGLKNGAQVSSGLGYNIGISAAHTRRASDLPSDSVNLSKAYRDYLDFFEISDPANSLSTGIRIGDDVLGDMYHLSYVQSFEGARNDSGNIMSLTQGSNAFGDYFETSGSYIRIFNYMNKAFEF